jgi:hypothetical protein
MGMFLKAMLVMAALATLATAAVLLLVTLVAIARAVRIALRLATKALARQTGELSGPPPKPEK